MATPSWSALTWQARLKQTLTEARNRAAAEGRTPRVALLAVGNPLLGDDGAGVALGRALQARLGAQPGPAEQNARPQIDAAVFMAETAPENFGGPPEQNARPQINAAVFIAETAPENFGGPPEQNTRPQIDAAVFIAETAPENFGGPLRRLAPDLVLWLDAADLGEPPGTVACLPWRAAEETRPGTHSGSPALLAGYLESETGAEVLLLTVQPESMGFGRPLSGAVAAAVEELAEELAGLLRG